jgi:hypothetical protein
MARVRARALARDVGGRPSALAELIGLLLWILLFARLQSAAGKDITAATADALALQSMERAMHIDIEGSANHWLAGHLVLSHLAVYLYRLYYAAIVGVLAWVFIRHAVNVGPPRRTPSRPGDHTDQGARRGCRGELIRIRVLAVRTASERVLMS